VSHRQALAAIRPQDAHILAGQGFLAGPLASVDTGEIVGMLKIERLGFLDFGPLGIQNFRILCDWIGTAFANARRFEESQKATYFDPLRGLLSANFFEQQREIIHKLAQRLKFDVTVIYVRVGNADDTEPAPRAPTDIPVAARLPRRLGHLCRQCCGERARILSLGSGQHPAHRHAVRKDRQQRFHLHEKAASLTTGT